MISSNQKKRLNSDALWGTVFLAPIVIGLLLFVLVPILCAVYISFTKYNLVNIKWYGLENYRRLFDSTRETQFWISIKNIIIFSVLNTSFSITLGLVLASMLKNNTKCSGMFKMIYYLPIVCSVVATTTIWGWLYNSVYGPIAKLLNFFGVFGYEYFEPANVIPSMVLMCVWGGFGTSMLLYFAALKNISSTLYESASIDGATGIQSFLHITLPMVSPTTFYLLLTGLIGSLQAYSQFLSIGLDGYTPVLIVYNYAGHGYGTNSYGYACAMGLTYGLFVGFLAFINFKLSKYWVCYDV